MTFGLSETLVIGSHFYGPISNVASHPATCGCLIAVEGRVDSLSQERRHRLEVSRSLPSSGQDGPEHKPETAGMRIILSRGGCCPVPLQQTDRLPN